MTKRAAIESPVEHSITTRIENEERNEENEGRLVSTKLAKEDELMPQQQHIILFYKYHALSDDHVVMEQYRIILYNLCSSLQLKGRILIGCSKHEGINGTLSGSYNSVLYFTYALLKKQCYEDRKQTQISDPTPNTKDQQLLRDYDAVLIKFWNDCDEFFASINEAELQMNTPNDFKWSTASPLSSNESNTIFPDLNVKLVNELIGTGGTLSSISLDELSNGYLTPTEWHNELLKLNNENTNDKNDTILLDCRNMKEYDIGRFTGAIDPQTTTFAQFPKWVRDHKYTLENKNVLMYCTGGIRCEKASAYIRQIIPTVRSVKHLHGGIHKYLEKYGKTNSSCNDDNNNNDNSGAAVPPEKQQQLWVGKNFVFDGRVAAPPINHGRINNSDNIGASNEITDDNQPNGDFDATVKKLDSNDELGSSSVINSLSLRRGSGNNNNTDVVGRCINCTKPYENFDPLRVCTVCREPVLICTDCILERNGEYHCKNHYHLREYYFSNIEPYTVAELNYQLNGLIRYHDDIAIGRKFKQKRKTLVKQMIRLQNEINNRVNSINAKTNDVQHQGDDGEPPTDNNSNSNTMLPPTKCRNCGDVQCTGRCWGFFGLKRKQTLESRAKDQLHLHQQQLHGKHDNNNARQTKTVKEQNGAHQQLSRVGSVGASRSELSRHSFFAPPSQFRDRSTGIRIVPCTTRYVQCHVKAKWCGESALHVVQNEFIELSRSDVLQNVLQYGLLRVNDKPISSHEIADLKLKISDTIGRLVHWHEPPVHVPDFIEITEVEIPIEIFKEYGIDSGDDVGNDGSVYVCNKPSSVPVHPAGPYYWNSLTTMVEAQIGLQPKSLKTIHRTDRVTSGLTLCCTSSTVARLFHQCLIDGNVRKLYIAQVNGKFPSSLEECIGLIGLRVQSLAGSFSYLAGTKSILIDGPIYTADISNGIRSVDEKGKLSQSVFKFIQYDDQTNTSLISCDPVTGRNHQLRVHLQWLGFPIVGDVLYGGSSDPSMNQKQRAINLTLKMISEQNESEMTRTCDDAVPTELFSSYRHDSIISYDDAVAAKRACPCCAGISNGGVCTHEDVMKLFTPAQLLESGHAIRLHALRYRLQIVSPRKSKKKKMKKVDDASAIHREQKQEFLSECVQQVQFMREIDFQVDMPDWAAGINLSLLENE